MREVGAADVAFGPAVPAIGAIRADGELLTAAEQVAELANDIDRAVRARRRSSVLPLHTPAGAHRGIPHVGEGRAVGGLQMAAAHAMRGKRADYCLPSHTQNACRAVTR